MPRRRKPRQAVLPGDTMDAADFKQVAKRPRSRDEQIMTQSILNAARALGYLAYHDLDSRKNEPGFPDVHIVGRGKHLILECKVPPNGPTEAQKQWIAEYRAAGVDCRIITPAEVDDLYRELAGDWLKDGL